MIALLKYGTGLPFHRLERLEGSLGIPLPATTQWGIVEHGGHQLEPALGELTRQAAQGDIFHNDDTGAKVLALTGGARDPLGSDLPDLPDRTGVFTSGIVSILPGYRIALFFTGRRHAGENLAAVLQQRAAELGPPIQMCDALSRNLPEPLKTILGNCLTHGRRHFVDVAMNFPHECLYVLLILKDVYTNDALAKEQGLSPEQRLDFHQKNSGPKMEELKTWLAAQIEERKVEPNSGLGKAIAYMRNHWNELTLFLRQPGAPLGRVETWRGGLGGAYLLPALSSAGASITPPCSVSTSRSSNRTCSFPASGSPSESQAFAFSMASRLVGSSYNPSVS